MKLISFTILSLSLLSTEAMAAAPLVTTPGSGGVTGALLGMPLGARARALGGAYTGAASDCSAAWWNPAGLRQIESFNTELGYAAQQDAAKVTQWAGALPIGPGNLGMGVTFLDAGTYEVRNDRGIPGNTVALSEMALELAWAMSNPAWMPVPGAWGVALAAADDVLGSWTPAMSVGEQIMFSEGWRIGVAVRNLGAPSDGYHPPIAADAGIAWRPRSYLTALVDARYGIGDGLYRAAAGLEWNPEQVISIRLGFKVNPDNGGKISTTSPTGGFGLRWKRIGLNYVYEPMGDLGTQNLLSLTWGVFRK